MQRATCVWQVARDRSIERSKTLVDPKLTYADTIGESFSDRDAVTGPDISPNQKPLGEDGGRVHTSRLAVASDLGRIDG